MNFIVKLAVTTLCLCLSLWLLLEIKGQLSEQLQEQNQKHKIAKPALTAVNANGTNNNSGSNTNFTTKHRANDYQASSNDSSSSNRFQSSNQPQGLAANIQSLLAAEQYSTAVDSFNQEYDGLANNEVTALKSIFFRTAQDLVKANKLAKSESLIRNYLELIQDQQAYLILADILIQQKKFPDAIDATINAHGFAFDSDQQAQIEAFTINTALQLTSANAYTNAEVLDNLLRVHYLFPANEALQFELAKLYYQNGDTEKSKNYLRRLSYAGNLHADASQKLLAQIDAQLEQKEKSIATAKPEIATPEPRLFGEHVVQLRRVGTSYLVDVLVENKAITLLLDTGASITALSDTVVRRLNLKRTSRNIRLATANGTTTSQIYQAKSLRLANIEIKDLNIAEIDLGNKGQIDGLLGTDILQRFNYQINADSNSLVLKPR